MADIALISPGFYSSIQDLGRRAIAKYGVPQAGAMDAFSAAKANLLLNNDPNAALLEITFSGPKIRFNTAMSICISGAHFEVKCNGITLKNDKAHSINVGDVVNFGALLTGFRAYLAFSGGIDTPIILGSRSQYEGITTHFRLKKGDNLNILGSGKVLKESSARVQFNDAGIFDTKIEVSAGPEYHLLNAVQKEQLLETEYTILPSSNRMAIQFKEKIENELSGITTAATLPGTVQLTPKGGLVVLMRDCQVTGGYPRILQLSEMGVNIIAQQAPGKSIFFEMPSK
jgi:biotin-dependent carboxylase-like uncharacterized protein